MTKEQKQEKSNEKAKTINALCEKLQVVISAEQMITEKGFIKMVVFYNDVEKYDVGDGTNNEKTDEKTIDLRKKNA